MPRPSKSNSKLSEGSTIICESGHEIAVTKIPLYVGKHNSVDWFDWKIKPSPKDGQPFKPCPVCGKDYVKQKVLGRGLVGPALNVKDLGWWP